MYELARIINRNNWKLHGKPVSFIAFEWDLVVEN